MTPATLYVPVVLWLAGSGAAADEEIARVRRLRIEGKLADAREAAERGLAGQAPGLERQVDLHLELARIHDRVGLHDNTRPVVASLRHIEAASALALSSTPRSRASVEMARAEYHYRAEMDGPAFPVSTAHARRALALFRELQDPHGEADALHTLGLIRFHLGDLDPARELLEQAKELDSSGGERPLFQADYERHVGYVLVQRREIAAAIPHFERSLALRRDAGAVDASLFAATTLAQALVDSGRFDEARPPPPVRDAGRGATGVALGPGEERRRADADVRADGGYRVRAPGGRDDAARRGGDRPLLRLPTSA